MASQAGRDKRTGWARRGNPLGDLGRGCNHRRRVAGIAQGLGQVDRPIAERRLPVPADGKRAFGSPLLAARVVEVRVRQDDYVHLIQADAQGGHVLFQRRRGCGRRVVADIE